MQKNCTLPRLGSQCCSELTKTMFDQGPELDQWIEPIQGLDACKQPDRKIIHEFFNHSKDRYCQEAERMHDQVDCKFSQNGKECTVNNMQWGCCWSFRHAVESKNTNWAVHEKFCHSDVLNLMGAPGPHVS